MQAQYKLRLTLIFCMPILGKTISMFLAEDVGLDVHRGFQGVCMFPNLRSSIIDIWRIGGDTSLCALSSLVGACYVNFFLQPSFEKFLKEVVKKLKN